METVAKPLTEDPQSQVPTPNALIDPTQAAELAAYMMAHCETPAYLVNLEGKRYPKLEWWNTIAALLGLAPRVVYARRLDREDEVVYEAAVEVYRGEQRILRAEALCSDREARWQGADEFMIKSMSITRACGKAYRISLSFLAVMAGLEGTPAEEMPVARGPCAVSVPNTATEKQRERLQRLAEHCMLNGAEQGELRQAVNASLSKAEASALITRTNRLINARNREARENE